MHYYKTSIAACDETTIRINTRRSTLSDSSTCDDTRCEAEDDNLVTNNVIKSSGDEDISSKTSERTSSSFEICNYETSISIHDSSSLSEGDSKLENHNHLFERNSMDNKNDSHITLPKDIDDSELPSSDENQDNFVSDKTLKSPGIMYTDANEVSSVSEMINKKEKALSHDNEKQLTDSKGESFDF